MQLLARGSLVLELCAVVAAFSPPRDASGPFRRVFTRKWVIDMETALDLSLESEILWHPRRRKHNYEIWQLSIFKESVSFMVMRRGNICSRMVNPQLLSSRDFNGGFGQKM